MFGSSQGLLRRGETVDLDDLGLSCAVGELLGSGSQGEVYEADLRGHRFALKWYYPNWATRAHRLTLDRLIALGPPDPGFLWPFGVATRRAGSDFGYVMPLREERYHPLSDVVTFKIDPPLKVLAHTARNLAHRFLALHANGLSYKDISLGNVFFDPRTGEVVVCDNDNADFDLEQRSGVLGTPKFMAPEIVRDEAGTSSLTDLFSLAVLLFYLLMAHHPLEGRREAAHACLDAAAMKALYGTHPVFVFDPDNAGNRPVPGIHNSVLALWPIFPGFVGELFTRAFTSGLADPHARVRETEWRMAMARLADAVTYCRHCKAENFIDATGPKDGQSEIVCWSCRQGFARPQMLSFEHTTVALNSNTELHPHHVDSARQYEYAPVTGRMVRHPSEQRRWGLQNLSGVQWRVTFSDGTVAVVPSQRTVELQNGATFDFGSRTAVVV